MDLLFISSAKALNVPWSFFMGELSESPSAQQDSASIDELKTVLEVRKTEQKGLNFLGKCGCL